MLVEDKVKKSKVSKKHRNMFENNVNIMYGEEDEDDYDDLESDDSEDDESD